MKPGESGIKTLNDVSNFIRNDDALTKGEKSQYSSASNTLAKVTGQPPEAIIADPSVIRALRKKAPWKLVGLSKKRWANVLSLVTGAMERTGIKVHRSRRNYPIDPCWEQLLEKSPHDNGLSGLKRFAGWCSMIRITPEQVTVAVFDDYLRYFQERSIQSNPRERWHQARRA